MIESGCLQRKGDKYSDIGMTYCISATQGQSKKVTIMVGTFLKEKSVKVPAAKMEPKKGYHYGGNLFEFSACDSIIHQNGAEKGYHYGGNLFEREGFESFSH